MNAWSRRCLGAMAGLAMASGAMGQPTDQCGALSPALSVDVPMAGDNSSAFTDFEFPDGICSGFSGAGGGVSDVYARFTPAVTGAYRFSTCGSTLDTVVSVHSACPASPENAIGCNDDDCDVQSRLDVHLTAGVEYHVRVAVNPFWAPGPFTLTATALAAPTNDACGNAIAVVPGSSTPGSTVNATGEDLATCAIDGKDVWYALTTTSAGVYTITAGGDHPDILVSLFDACGGGSLGCESSLFFGPPTTASMVAELSGSSTYLVRVSGRRGFSGQPPEGTFTLDVSLPQPPLPNDTCFGATVVSPGSVTAGTTVGSTAGAQSGCSNNDRFDVWYSVSVPSLAQYVISTTPEGGFDTALSVFDACNGLQLACQDQFGGEAAQLFLNPGTPYLVRVAGNNSQTGGFTLTVDAGTPIPANDQCAAATTIGTGTTQGSNVASGGVDETPFCGFDDVHDVWYRFVAPQAGYYTFDTVGSTGLSNSTVSLFASCGSAVLVCNDDIATENSGANELSMVGRVLGVGEQVWVRVAGSLGTTGGFDLSVTGPLATPAAPSNDHCSAAKAILSYAFNESVDARSAGPDIDSLCNYEDLPETSHGVWYTFFAQESGVLFFTETGPLWTSVSYWRGDACAGNFDQLQCGEVQLEVAPGERISFLVGAIGVEYPATPYEVGFTFEPQLGCCTLATGCTLAPRSACAGGTWTESLCGPSTSHTGGSNLPLVVPNPPSNGNPTFVSTVINVPDSVTISNVSVTTTLIVENASDLVMRLTSPQGTAVLLHNSTIASSYSGTYTFSDIGLWSAIELINENPILDRTLTPHQSLSALAGQNSAGAWTLTLGDDRRFGQVGQLNDWSIRIHEACVATCIADFNGVGGVTVQDIFDFLGAYFTGSPTADVNGQGGVTVQDIFDFLTAYFAGC